MSSESRLYTFSPETKDQLRKFRLSTSRSSSPQAKIYEISKSDLTITPCEETYTSLLDLSDDLPENSPRFALLSYPMTLDSGRLSVPYVMISYIPATCTAEMRMLYAGAKELFRNQSEAGRIVEISEAEEVEGIEKVLRGED